MVSDIVYLLAIVSLFIALLTLGYMLYELFALIKESCRHILNVIIINRKIAETTLNESLDHARETLLSEIVKNLPMEDLPND